MDKRKLILLCSALLIAVVTAFMAKSMFTGAAAPKAAAVQVKKESGKEVLVATRAMPVGTIITPESFRFQPWPEEMIEEAYYLKGEVDPASLAGTVVRTSITAGQPATQGALVQPGDRGFLAAALGPGMRAVTVPVSGLTGVAGFVFPGDRVDLMLTQTVSGQGPDMKVSETVIRNLRVLATDNRVTSKTNTEGQMVATKTKLVTLEATPQIAEKISVAQTLGTLSLSLRSLADSAAELDQAIASGKLKMPETDDPVEEARMLQSLAARPVAEKSSYSTGGDVSRFQRKTPPPLEAQEKPKGPSVKVVRGDNVSTVQFGEN